MQLYWYVNKLLACSKPENEYVWGLTPSCPISSSSCDCFPHQAATAIDWMRRLVYQDLWLHIMCNCNFACEEVPCDSTGWEAAWKARTHMKNQTCAAQGFVSMCIKLISDCLASEAKGFSGSLGFNSLSCCFSTSHRFQWHVDCSRLGQKWMLGLFVLFAVEFIKWRNWATGQSRSFVSRNAPVSGFPWNIAWQKKATDTSNASKCKVSTRKKPCAIPIWHLDAFGIIWLYLVHSYFHDDCEPAQENKVQ